MTQSLNSPIVALPVASGWADYGGGWHGGQYWKDPHGLVHLRGMIGHSAAWSFPILVATLPAGFRPTASEMFAQVAHDGTTGDMITRVDVNSNGTIQVPSSVPAASGVSFDWLSLSGITFFAGV